MKIELNSPAILEGIEGEVLPLPAYRLTNTYFEGQKQGSSLAQFGRSKEKHCDAKLEVLALVINVEGFIKYSSILQGNIADRHTVSGHPVVVLDAGIATEDNLELIRTKKDHYACVSRSLSSEIQRLQQLLERDCAHRQHTKNNNRHRAKHVR